MTPKRQIKIRKPLVVFMIGKPLSGKSTLAKKITKKFDFKILSADEIRRQIFQTWPEFNEQNNTKVFTELKKQLRQTIRDKRSVIFDSSNIHKDRQSDLELIQKLKAEILLLDFDVSKVELEKRRTRRNTKAPIQISKQELNNWHIDPLTAREKRMGTVLPVRFRKYKEDEKAIFVFLNNYFIQETKLSAAQKTKKLTNKSVKKTKSKRITKKTTKQKTGSPQSKTSKSQPIQKGKPRTRLHILAYKPSAFRLFLSLGLAILVAIGISGSLFVASEWYFAKRIFPGVTLLGQSIGGQTREQTASDLREKISTFANTPFIFHINEEEYEIKPQELGIEISIAETMRQAWSWGHQGSFLTQIQKRSSSLLMGKEIPLSVRVDESQMRNRLETLIELRPPQFSDLVEFDRYRRIHLREEIPQFYQTDWEEIADKLLTLAEILSPQSINIKLKNYSLKITKAEILALNDKMTTWSEREISLVYRLDYRHNDFTLNFGGDPSWFILRNTNSKKQLGEKLDLTLNETKLNQFLEEQVVPDVTHTQVDAHISFGENGEIVVDGQAHAGEKLNFDSAKQLILAALQHETKTVFLPIKVTPPVVTVDPEVNEKYGITGLLSTGWSDFSYSPSNRINNIKVGLRKFDGLLIAPGETFSFNQNLGYVGSATGFLPELVIKGAQTIPEFGGGLCQVSTTHYRAALLAGLPILERKPHTYHVFHYEPGGSDATIYPPSPDIKFLNDTDSYILLQTWTDENGIDAYVDLYGAPDGRQVELTGPWISRYRRPGPPIEVPTTDLAPGQRVVQEYQVYGFDALWKRVISYANGEKKEEEIKSRYAPWPSVIKVGVESVGE